jgi:predicted secreted protein
MMNRACFLSMAFALSIMLSAMGNPVYAEALNYNVIDLSAQARRQVSNDVMQATLFAESVGPVPAKLAAEVNEQLNKAISAAKKIKSVRVESGDYHSQANYQDGKQQGWRTRGEVRLESTDFAALATLLGQLQNDALQLANVQFSVSPQLRDQVENELIREALKAFQKRADVVKQSLDRNSVKIVSIRLDTQNAFPTPRPVYRVNAMMAKDVAEAAPAEAGNSEIIVVASGSVQVE